MHNYPSRSIMMDLRQFYHRKNAISVHLPTVIYTCFGNLPRFYDLEGRTDVHMTNYSKQWVVWLAFAAIYIIWGSTYLAILFGLEDLPPFLLSGLRFLLAGILLYGWCLLKKEPAPSLLSVGRNSLYGILMLFGGTGSVAWSEQYISSGLAAIIVTSIPFWFILLDKKQWSFYFSNKMILAGLLVGFAGVALLVSQGEHATANKATTGEQITGIVVILAGGIAWTMGSLFAKYRPTNSGLVMNSSLQLLTSGLFTLLVSAVSGEWRGFSITQVQAPAWGAVVYLAVMGSLVAYSSYLFLLKLRPAALVSSYVYINPVVALILGALFMHERVTWMHVFSLLIILLGVLLINWDKYVARLKN